jgi:hypothetical protein
MICWPSPPSECRWPGRVGEDGDRPGRCSLLHGPERKGKYQVFPVLIYLKDECPKDEAVLDMTVPSGYGIRHAPLLWEIGKDVAADALAAFAENKATWGILFWIPLMAGAENPLLVQQWQTLVADLPAPDQANLLGIALVFAELVGRGQVWRPILERWNMTESPIVNEWIAEAANLRELDTWREAVLDVLKRRFPNQVPPELAETINGQPGLDLLKDWHGQAAVVGTIEDFRAYLRR